MEQFNLDSWLKDKSRKLVTRDGRPARIICWDRKSTPNRLPIIVLEEREDTECVSFVSNYGRADLSGMNNPHDIFFAEEEDELTNLQKTLEEDCDSYVNLYNDGKTREELREWIKGWCPRIIDLARKEILKDFPKWKDSWSTDDNTKPQIIGDCLVVGDNLIHISDLVNKLPKEE